ncbi:hypothetical protein KY290_030812 [Solanum tuberosum]|uniref:Uncharacterized protein n=1 Tax=Solanum tuberosum TaxID=4113 RepID=A0ABQ7U9B7_SOLTU|nr:hypothetical protein KY290_030812 [Solanum tuberosum]
MEQVQLPEGVTPPSGIRNEATSKLNSVYEEIHPVIEMYGPDNQDSVPIRMAEKWIEAKCSKYKAEFDLYFSMIKNAMFPLIPATDATAAGPSEGGTGSQTANAEEGTGPQTGNACLSCFSCCV